MTKPANSKRQTVPRWFTYQKAGRYRR